MVEWRTSGTIIPSTGRKFIKIKVPPTVLLGGSKHYFKEDQLFFAANSLLMIFNAPPALNHSICCSL
jgi:hypothetical protein